MTAIYSLVIEWNRTHWSSTGSSVGMGFCQVKVTLLHKIFVAKYIFIFNRVLCCKNWKNETLIGITKMDFSKALFFVAFVKTVEGYRVKSLS